MREDEARRVLAAYCRQEHGKEPSTFTVRQAASMERAHAEWWLANPGVTARLNPPPDGPRSRAYLKAYVEIAGERFFATGIPLDNGGVLLPDRGIMKSLLRSGYIRLDRARFVLTERGEALVSSVRTARA